MATAREGRGSLIVGCMAFAGILLANASPLLPGLHSDGLQYLEAARSIARWEGVRLPIGDWASADSTSMLAHYPPGFPAIMAPPIAAGISPPLVAVVTMAIAAGVAVAFSFSLAALLTGRVAAGWIAAGFVGLHPEWVRLHTAVWSEPVYLALLLAAVYTMVRTPERTGLHVALALACTTVRFVGVSVAAGAAVVAWRQGSTSSERLRKSALALAPSVLFVLAWAQLARAGGGSVRTPDTYPGWLDWAARLVSAFAASMAPAGGRWVGVLLLLAVVGLAIRSDLWRLDRWRAFVALAGVLIGSHLVLLSASRIAADPLIPADSRMLISVLALIGIGAGAVVGELFVAQRGRSTVAATLMVVAWAVPAAWRISNGVGDIQANGQFYTSTVWLRSGLVSWARDNALRGPIAYSNEPELLFLHTRRPVRRLPVAGEDLTAFRDAYRLRPGPIILVNPPKATDLPAAALVDGLDLVMVRASSEGVVFSTPQAAASLP